MDAESTGGSKVVGDENRVAIRQRPQATLPISPSSALKAAETISFTLLGRRHSCKSGGLFD